jgi:hypothetical protein
MTWGFAYAQRSAVHTENFARAGHAVTADRDIAIPSTEQVCDVAIDMADALARCVASGAEQPLVQASLSWSQRAQLQGVCDPVPSRVEISVYADEQLRGSRLGFYLIASEYDEEIGHAEHGSLAAAIDAAEAEYGIPRTAWAAAP